MGLRENRETYLAVDEDKRLSAQNFLYAILEKDRKEIKKSIEADPVTWFAPVHFFWGMGVRNALRTVGYDEKYFGIENLDDIYVELIEDALEGVQV